MCGTTVIRNFKFTFTCEEAGGGNITARVTAAAEPPAPSFALSSNAPNGVLDGTGLTGNQVLIQTGPTPNTHYRSGDYAASTAPFAGQPEGVSVFGQVIAGTVLAGGDCKLGATAHG